MELILTGPAAEAARQAGDAQKSGGLAPGRLVKGTVLGPGPEGKTLVRFMGGAFAANSATPLAPGQSLTLQVVRTSPQLVFALVGDESEKAPAALPNAQLLAQPKLSPLLTRLMGADLAGAPIKSPDLARAVAQLKEAAARMVLDESKAGDPQALRTALKTSGQDLLGQMAKAAQAGAGPPGPSPVAQAVANTVRGLAHLLVARLGEELAAISGKGDPQDAVLKELLEVSDGLSSLMKAGNELNGELFPRQNTIYFSLPFAMDGQIRQGQFLLSLPEKGKEGGSGGQATRMVFFLNLSALGPISIDAAMGPGRVDARIYTTSHTKAQFLNQRLDDLRESLGRLGFASNLAALVKSAPEIEAEAPLARLISEQGQGFSITV